MSSESFSDPLSFARYLFLSGTYSEAKNICLELIKKEPENLNALFLLGQIIWEEGNKEEAINYFKKCAELNPQAVGAIRYIGVFFHERKEYERAIHHFQDILYKKEDITSCHALSTIYLLLGYTKEAYDYAKKASSIDSKNKYISQQQLMISLFCDEINPREIFDLHLNWSDRQVELIAPFIPLAPENKSPGEKIRIGYVCHDTFKQSVSFFFEPTVKNHDRLKFYITIYATFPEEDAYAEQLKTYVDCWRNVSSLEEKEIAEIIYQDKIDILVDVTGHTAPGSSNNKLLTFAYKPAPIQISWLAYPATTGLRTIDYRITDEWADPTGMTEAYHTEKLIRLPQGFLCYQPEADSPEVSDAPCKSNSYITFGCFTLQSKITPEVVRIWTSILKKVEGSRLYLKYKHFQYPDIRSAFLKRFSENGVEEDRIQFIDFQPSYHDHLDCYRYLDVVLDPFPYNGTTSTHEALWMGVPVITLAGNDHRSRVGVSILSRIDLPNLIAHSVEEYIQIAINLSKNKEQIQELRKTLRPRMLNSPLTQAKEFTAQLEAEYIKLWEAFLDH
ncbi:MAG: tetratricopeptide repeat protein [Cyanobacteriota bacterium]